jgi:hypothetical protein
MDGEVNQQKRRIFWLDLVTLGRRMMGVSLFVFQTKNCIAWCENRLMGGTFVVLNLALYHVMWSGVELELGLIYIPG